MGKKEVYTEKCLLITKWMELFGEGADIWDGTRREHGISTSEGMEVFPSQKGNLKEVSCGNGLGSG